MKNGQPTKATGYVSFNSLCNFLERKWKTAGFYLKVSRFAF